MLRRKTNSSLNSNSSSNIIKKIAAYDHDIKDAIGSSSSSSSSNSSHCNSSSNSSSSREETMTIADADNNDNNDNNLNTNSSFIKTYIADRKSLATKHSDLDDGTFLPEDLIKIIFPRNENLKVRVRNSTDDGWDKVDARLLPSLISCEISHRTIITEQWLPWYDPNL